jgi:hypothetical protein
MEAILAMSLRDNPPYFPPGGFVAAVSEAGGVVGAGAGVGGAAGAGVGVGAGADVEAEGLSSFFGSSFFSAKS